MPATLGHLGVQALLTRAVLRGADLKWIWTACVIPDLPWIVQRAARGLLPGLDPLSIRLYAVVQSSLAISLLLCAALCAFSTRRGRTFAILSGGCLLHLLLDALQIKLANGVVLLAPFSWEVWSLGLFWPESVATFALLALGAAYCVYAWIAITPDGSDLWRPGIGGSVAVAVLLSGYVALPVVLSPFALRADAHFVQTLRDVDTRPGKAVEFDRNRLRATTEGTMLDIWTGDTLTLASPEAATPVPGIVSVRGHFVTRTVVEATLLHRHPPGLRSAASYLGLAVMVIWWMRCLMARRRGIRHIGR